MSQGTVTDCGFPSSFGSRSTTTGSVASAMNTAFDVPEGSSRAYSNPRRGELGEATSRREGPAGAGSAGAGGVIVTTFRSSGRPSTTRSGAGAPPRLRPTSVNVAGTPGAATAGTTASRYGPELSVRRYG